MIETIPPLIHAGILFGLWVFAAGRGGDFPRTLTAIYAAFFFITYAGGYLVSQEVIPLTIQILFASLAVCKCYDYAYQGRKIKAVNKFCQAMMCFMLTLVYSLMVETNRDNVSEETLNTLINVHNLISDILSLYVMYVLVEIIDGARGDPIYSKLGAILSDALAIFAPNTESFHYQNQRKSGNR